MKQWIRQLLRGFPYPALALVIPMGAVMVMAAYQSSRVFARPPEGAFSVTTLVAYLVGGVPGWREFS
ncbi:MAG: hypothetical protein PHO66_01805, partial [Eubacteriales bacterium]|nr:hypothetical protein [Eubacteriales bacterium]